MAERSFGGYFRYHMEQDFRIPTPQTFGSGAAQLAWNILQVVSAYVVVAKASKIVGDMTIATFRTLLAGAALSLVLPRSRAY